MSSLIGGGKQVRVTIYGDQNRRTVVIPTSPTAPAIPVGGLYEQYSGSLAFDGLPIMAAETCVSGNDGAVPRWFIGFEVDAPATQ